MFWLPMRCAAANSAGSRVSRICAPARWCSSTCSSVSGLSPSASDSSSVGCSLRVQHRVVGEVRRRVGLIRGDEVDERVPRHRLQRVVRSALFADGRERLLAQRLAAERAGAVRRIDEAVVGQRQELGLQRVVEQAAERRGRPAEGAAQVGPPDVADEQRVAGQHGVRVRVAAVAIEHQQRDRFRRVARRLERLEPHAAEIDRVAVVQGEVNAYSACGRWRPGRWSRPSDRAARDARPGNPRAGGSG